LPFANINGTSINYKIVGSDGPWVVLCPGGRNGYKNVKRMSNKVAKAGFRVVLHDRRNCGASDFSIEGQGSEYELWADELHGLLKQLGAAPAFVGGSSSGCRMAMVLAVRHPEAARGLLLWRVTGGVRGARRLAKRYYQDPIDAAKKGGMKGVCEMEFFQELIAERAETGKMLMAMDPKRFIEVMSRWNEEFLAGADLPVIGATEAQLRSIKMPAFVIPGNDWTHMPATGANLGKLMPNAEVHPIDVKLYEVDVAPKEEWHAREDEIVGLFVDFMKRVESGAVKSRAA
jgi:pimeloyl-ACP methyl ester carboxylesterase